jgi:ATP phosphoribosyltransferase
MRSRKNQFAGLFRIFEQIIRASDVSTYVENGAADLGVAGKDVLMEHGAQHVYKSAAPFST